MGGSGTIIWRGSLPRSGAQRSLAGAWVRRNFKTSFIEAVIAEGGKFKPVPTGRAQDRPALSGTDQGLEPCYGATAICKLGSPEVRYQQGSADLCAAYGLASALQYRGDAEAASAIALCARGALASRDAFGHVRDVINSAAVEGWAVLTLKGHKPLSTIIADPINLRRRLELYCTKSLLRNHAVRKRVL